MHRDSLFARGFFGFLFVVVVFVFLCFFFLPTITSALGKSNESLSMEIIVIPYFHMAASRSTGTCPEREAGSSCVAFYYPAHKCHCFTSEALC